MSGPLIYYLSNSTLPSRDANAVQVTAMCAALARQGARVELHFRWGKEAGGADRSGAARADRVRERYGVNHPGERFELRGTGVPRIPVVGRALRSLLVLLRLGFAPRPDLLYGRDAYALALVALARFPRVPIVYEVHRPPKNGLEHRLQRTIFRSRRFAGVVVISEALAEEYRRRFGPELGARILLARDGADPAPESGAPSEPNAQPFRVGYVGSLAPGKGMELIVRLAHRMPGCSFHVIGGAPDEVAGWRERAPDNLALHGFMAPEAARARLAEFDVLLAPYRRAVLVGDKAVDVARWMSPLKVFEGMAAGKALVASDLPALREFLRDGENAVLARPDDEEHWVECLTRLERDRELRARLGAAARAEFLAEYTWDARARRLLAQEATWTRS